MPYFFSPQSLPPSLSLSQWQRKTNTKTIAPRGSFSETEQKKRKKRKKKDKREKWSRRNLWLLPPSAVSTRLNLREIAGDTASMRDQSGFLLCFAYTSNTINNVFCCPAKHMQGPDGTCTPRAAYSGIWHLPALSAERLGSRDGSRLTAAPGLVKVTELGENSDRNTHKKTWFRDQKVSVIHWLALTSTSLDV